MRPWIPVTGKQRGLGVGVQPVQEPWETIRASGIQLE